MNDMLDILRHDLHKIRISSYESHKESLKNQHMVDADGTAAWFSRNEKKFNFETPYPFRISIMKGNRLAESIDKNELKEKLEKIFKIKDPVKLHSEVLKSKELNLINEAITHPYTSYKYHLLLTCCLYYNLKIGYNWTKLFLAENPEKCSEFQIIFKNNDREWALLPTGMSRVHPEFNKTWNRRIMSSIGGDDKELANYLTRIRSWSIVLSLIEEWNEK